MDLSRQTTDWINGLQTSITLPLTQRCYRVRVLRRFVSGARINRWLEKVNADEFNNVYSSHHMIKRENKSMKHAWIRWNMLAWKRQHKVYTGDLRWGGKIILKLIFKKHYETVLARWLWTGISVRYYSIRRTFYSSIYEKIFGGGGAGGGANILQGIAQFMQSHKAMTYTVWISMGRW